MIPVWDQKKGVRTERPMSSLAIHEMVDFVVGEGGESVACSLDGQQEGFKLKMNRWAARIGVDETNLKNYAALSLWDDSAPYSKARGDSLFLWTFSFLSGSDKRKYWVCAHTKRDLCQCGCLGRHTADGVITVISWMFRALLTRRYPSVDQLGDPWGLLSRGDRRGRRSH